MSDTKTSRGMIAVDKMGGKVLFLNPITYETEIVIEPKFTEQHVPSIKAKGLTPAQGLLQAIWSDERFSASCVTLKTIEEVRGDTVIVVWDGRGITIDDQPYENSYAWIMKMHA